MSYKKLAIYAFALTSLFTYASAAEKKAQGTPIVTPLSEEYRPTQGLQGRHLAIWNSHGLYYNQIEGEWRWQRARLLGTVEDLHTTDYVLSYLVPMLENAGAYVFLPRERDTNPIELIIDNDSPGTTQYCETGAWKNGSTPGFAYKRETYEDTMNPFVDGSYRYTKSVKGKATASATWQIPIAVDGNYAVYISFKSESNSTKDAHYTVHHAGGETSFSVNQTMGGGTWIYLGNFEFTINGDNRVVLDNQSDVAGRTITADAVKVGGGMGNIARKPCLEPRKPTKEALNNLKAQQKRDARRKKKRKKKSPAKANHIHSAHTSEYPRYAEAARYWMQWAGVPDTIYSDTGGDNDYYDDLRGRGYWLNYLCGGSKILPDSVGLHIPLDAALAFHSDAGNEPGDSIVGSMGIYYTGRGKKERYYANGTRRTESQQLAQCILGQISHDVRQIEPRWTIRKDRNKRYAEARIGEVPTLLLESMSHQNFTDMRYGLDPRFKFIMSRAIYKGLLRYLSKRNGTPYVVQPLPVSHMALRWKGVDQIELTWQAVSDTIESTAQPTCYKVYTRCDRYGWDNGTITTEPRYSRPLDPDVTYSFYVTALNKGGESFPSEILSARRVQGSQETVMIVNAFDRICAPSAWEDTTGTYAGFRYDIDGGVPYHHTVAYTGEQYEFNRTIEWKSDDDPGFGASKDDYEGMSIAGNTFDYPIVHGEAIARLGYSFLSASDEAVTDGIVNLNYYPYVDVIMGKERTTIFGNDSTRNDFTCFTSEMIDALSGYCDSGGRLLISGAYVGRDVWDNSIATDKARMFTQRVMHYKWGESHRSHKETLARSIVPGYNHATYRWEGRPNEKCYAVEETDVLLPVGKGAATFLIYSNHNSAAVAYDNGIYKCCTIGFPIEAIIDEENRNEIMKEIFQFFNHQQKP